MQLQDVFWTGFADEVEKIAGKGGALALGAVGAGAALAAAMGGDPKKVVPNSQAKLKDQLKSRNSRFEAQTGEDY
tara:strand:+ start:193 stop:417 length:225 start_codon:yes stop_codon:yes gene_type:complete